MNQIKKILAPTDLSELSQAGVRYALTLARALGAEVTVYHVVNCNELAQFGGTHEKGTIDITSQQYDRLRKGHQLALARFLNDHFSELIPWVKIREKVEIGVADKSIAEWAKRDGSDLIVISIHATGDLSHGLVGSVAAKVVANLPCPVLCIHAVPEEQAGEEAAAVA